ncbi:hypothetical protein [Brevundimonas diminuta]|uniref:hypothetical protein n=1 Tax=Brevundimonas diminuta TaxID=293 RepID=UPI001F57D34C|nr:hypothetical protein [Brevundimonas diminuta]
MKNLAQVAAPILLLATAACDQTQRGAELSNLVELTGRQEVTQLVERGEGRACAHDVVLNDIRKVATHNLIFSEEETWNGGWSRTSVEKFNNSFKSQLDRIVLNAHDPNASLVSCSAEHTASIDGKSFSTSIDYTVRLTVDREPFIELTDTQQLKNSAWSAQHLFYCEQIYPDQVQRHGTPYALVCTLHELERVPHANMRLSATQNAKGTMIDQQVRDFDRSLVELPPNSSGTASIASSSNGPVSSGEHRISPRQDAPTNRPINGN